MKNTYLVRVMTGPMAGTLKTASLEEWVSILRKNKGLPPESRRYNIPLRYFTYASATKCAEQVVREDMNA